MIANPRAHLKKLAKFRSSVRSAKANDELANINMARMCSVFGNQLKELSPEAKVQLSYLQYHSLPIVRERLENWRMIGELMAEVMLNRHLGTQAAGLSPRLWLQFWSLLSYPFQEVDGDGLPLVLSPTQETDPDRQDENRKMALAIRNDAAIGAASLGAVNLELGHDVCSKIVLEKIIKGPQGLSQLFLNDLGLGR